MTAATGVEIPISEIGLEPPLVGILAQLPRLEGPEGERWLRGMAFSPEAAVSPEMGELCETVVAAGTADRLANRAVHPFVVRLHDRCSTWGWSENDYVGRATRGLDVKRHWAVDREFEEGAQIATNLHLAATYAGAPDPTTVTLGGGVAVSPIDAMALLDEAIANSTAVIGRGVIWATTFIGAQWKHLGLLTVKAMEPGGRTTILSPAGNYVVIGTGFEGRGPDGSVPAAHASQWAYATDLVGVVVGAPQTLPGSLIEATDYATNTVVYRQEQWFAVLWAGLLHAAGLVDTATPVSSGGGGGGAGGGGPATNTMSYFAETSTVLAGAATRNGATHAANGYSRFRAFAASDQSGTLSIQQSADGTTWYTTLTQAVTGGTPEVLESIVARPYVRAVYVNGASLQTTFSFSTALVAI